MSLLTSLISYWKLDEASGNALDAHGSNTLTDNNTVGSATGKISNCRDFEQDSSEFFSHSDNADLSAGDIDVTWSAWVNLESKSAFRTILSKHNGLSIAGSEYLITHNATNDRFEAYFYQGSGNSGSVTASSFGAPSLGTWYHVVVWHDAANNQIGISVNNTANTASYSSGINDTSTAFYVGSTATGSYWDGQIDEVGFWKRVLTSQERTDLYNSGNGLAYPFATNKVGRGLLSSRKMSRLSLAG